MFLTYFEDWPQVYETLRQDVFLCVLRAAIVMTQWICDSRFMCVVLFTRGPWGLWEHWVISLTSPLYNRKELCSAQRMCSVLEREIMDYVGKGRSYLTGKTHTHTNTLLVVVLVYHSLLWERRLLDPSHQLSQMYDELALTEWDTNSPVIQTIATEDKYVRQYEWWKIIAL